MAAVEDHVGVVAGPVCRAKLQEGFDLGLQSLQGHAAGGVVAAKSLNEVVGEEALHAGQHACRAPVQLLYLVRRQQHGLTVGTVRQAKTKRSGQGMSNKSTTTCTAALNLNLWF